VTGRLSAIRRIAPELVASAELVIESTGEGLTEFTREAADFVERAGLADLDLIEQAGHRLTQRAAEQRMIVGDHQAIGRLRHGVNLHGCCGRCTRPAASFRNARRPPQILLRA
jgi:hypothetical protein